MKDGQLIIRELEPYKGFKIFRRIRVTINARNMQNSQIMYVACWEDGDNFDCKSTLKELKNSIDKYVK